jgi:hypothetical protein
MQMTAHILHVLPMMNWILNLLAEHGAKHPSFGCVANNNCTIFTHHLIIHITQRF